MRATYKLIAFIILTQLAPQVGLAQLGWIWPAKKESPAANPGSIDWIKLPKSRPATANAAAVAEQEMRGSNQSSAAPEQDLFVATNLPGRAVDRGDSVVQHVFSDANATPVISASGSQPDSEVKHVPWDHLFAESETRQSTPAKLVAAAVEQASPGESLDEFAAEVAETSMIGPADEIFASMPSLPTARVPQPLADNVKQLGLITVQPEQYSQAEATAPAALPSELGLITDQFPEYVLQNLQTASETQSDEETVIPIDIMPFKRLASGEELSVDGFYSVESMVGPMAGAETLFANLNIQDDFRDQPGLPLEAVRVDKDASGFGPEWPYQNYVWVSPTFSHAPLYFEQVNLERYGIGPNRYLQPVGSFVHFFGSVGLLPYKVLTQHPRERVYTLGHQRPGDCVAYQKRSLLGQSYPAEACKYFHDYSGYR